MKIEKILQSTTAILSLAWLFISLLSALEVAIIQLFKPEAINIAIASWLPFLRLLSGLGAIFIILIPAFKAFRKKSIGLKVLGYSVAGVLYVLVYVSLFVLLFQTINLKPSFSLFLAGVGETLMSDLHHVAAYYFFLLFICSSKDFFEERTAAVLKKEKMEKELTKTKLSVLKSQIHPHFLFNTINNVVGLMEEKSSVAQEMLVNLSNLLRISLDLDYSKKISLEKELDILSTYIAIEKSRFEHQLEISIELPEHLKEKKVPPFLLQPLVENAIKHGYKGGVKQLFIQINIRQASKHLILRVANNGSPLESIKEGVGLQNLRARLENIYPGQFDLSLHQEQAWVVNQINIPLL